MGDSDPAPTARLPGHMQTAGRLLSWVTQGTACSTMAVPRVCQERAGSVPGACRAILLR